MRIRALSLTLVLFASSMALAGTVKKKAADPPKHKDEVVADGVMMKRRDLMKTPPVADLGTARIWRVESTPEVSSLLVEVTGTIPLHFHPDGVHRMYVSQGKIRMTIGDDSMEMEAGDYMMIPRSVRHKVELVGKKPAVLGTVDMPPVDPKNIVWLEPPPAK